MRVSHCSVGATYLFAAPLAARSHCRTASSLLAGWRLSAGVRVGKRVELQKRAWRPKDEGSTGVAGSTPGGEEARKRQHAAGATSFMPTSQPPGSPPLMHTKVGSEYCSPSSMGGDKRGDKLMWPSSWGAGCALQHCSFEGRCAVVIPSHLQRPKRPPSSPPLALFSLILKNSGSCR